MKPKKTPYLWHYTVLELGNRTLVRGIVLKGSGKGYRIPRTIIANLFGVLGTYRKRSLNRAEIDIKCGEFETTVRTNNHGFFKILIPKTDCALPEISYRGNSLGISQDYPVQFRNSQKNLEIISDIDDTVLVSHAASIMRRLYTLLFFRPKKRKAITYTYDFLERASGLGLRTIYLSKSESNLFGLISTFIDHSELPDGALLLTPYLNFAQLIRHRKGKDYKVNNLNEIFENSDGKEFILLGDDSQGDLRSYASAAEKHRRKIRAVFIRKTGFGVNETRMKFLDSLRKMGIKTVYFSDEDEPDYSILEEIKS